MTNRKLSQKGFSLIELMVAVVILAMVIFGIFLAFSTGFRGMVDARDRTEAVNYIQKTLEEYKNTPFEKIQDKPMSLIEGTKFSNGSIVIDKETRLKKVITQVRWTARNGDIKLEEASTLIYGTEKTGELLDASEIVLYASPYFRILPNTSTDLYAEIHDPNGNIVTDKSYTINFTILEDGGDLGSFDEVSDLISLSQNTTKGIAVIEFWSKLDAEDGSVSIQASADLDGVTVSDTIVITISIGAEGIFMETVPESGLSPVGDPIVFNLYVVDASFTNDPGHVIDYPGTITLSATGPATLSVNSVTAPEGTASFTLNSNGTPGTVEVIASAPDLDLGYAEVTFTGGAVSIQLTPNYGSIYEGEPIEITITILDENLNQTPFTGFISITSDNGGSFDPISPIEFDNVSFKTVDFSYNVPTEGIEITATGDGLTTSNSIYIDVLESLTPSYIELSAIPSSVEAGGEEYSFLTATVYDNSDPAEVVTNYTNTITFSISGGTGYFLDGETPVFTVDVTPNNGRAYINLYSNSGGTTTVTVSSGSLTPVSINITFYSPASYILLTTDSDSAVANGEDYAVITATVYDVDGIIVTNYLYDISFSVSGVGDLSDENPITPTLGIAKVNLYSNFVGEATVTAESHDGSQEKDLDLQPVGGIDIDFTQPQNPTIQLLEDTIYGIDGFKTIIFEIEVTNANLLLEIIEISWSDNAADLKKIEIASPTSEMNYELIYNDTAPYPGFTVNGFTKNLLVGNSTFKLTFDNNMKNESITIIFTDVNGDGYTLPVFTI